MKYGKVFWSIACSIKTSEQTWNQRSVYIFVSYLPVLAAIRSCLFPGSLACHTVLEKAHEEIQCPITLQFVANLKLFTLAITCTFIDIFPKMSCFSRRKKTGLEDQIQPGMLMQPNSFPRAPYILCDHNIWQAGCWDCHGKSSLVSQQENQLNWQQTKKMLIPTMQNGIDL